MVVGLYVALQGAPALQPHHRSGEPVTAGQRLQGDLFPCKCPVAHANGFLFRRAPTSDSSSAISFGQFADKTSGLPAVTRTSSSMRIPILRKLVCSSCGPM